MVRKRGKCWTPAENQRLMSLMEGYTGEREYINLVSDELKKEFGRDASNETLLQRVRMLKSRPGVSKVKEDGPRYFVMIHTNGDKSTGRTKLCLTREEVAMFVQNNSVAGVTPEHTIFKKVKFELIVKEVEV